MGCMISIFNSYHKKCKTKKCQRLLYADENNYCSYCQYTNDIK